MISHLTLQPVKSVNGTIELPGSKSISNRALLLAAISNGTTYLSNLLDSEDIKYMLNTLSVLNINYKISKDRTKCKIIGCANILYSKKFLKLFLGNAGTVMRPLTAMFAIGKNNVILTGESRMKERPIGHLVDALKQGGANIKYLEKANYPPIYIKGGFTGGKIVIKGNISSQFLTSLLMIAPLTKNKTEIFVEGDLVSKPYIDITINLMKTFGISVKNNNYMNFSMLSNQNYQSPGNYFIESDASSASYFLAAAAIKGGKVRVNGIGKDSIQGDIKFANVLEKMGAKIEWGDNFIICIRDQLNAIDLDLNHIPDAAMTIAITALFAEGTTKIRNIFNWRVKETDRLIAMSNELQKLGAQVKIGKDYIFITPPKIIKYAKINTYNDHRMAMCFSLVSLSSTPVTIIDPKCVNKTFPNYFLQLKNILHY